MRLNQLATFATIGASALFLVSCIEVGDDGDGDGNGDGTEEIADADGDGLTDEEEAELGLNPNNADSDGDGWDDAAEVDAGTDGNVCWDVPEGWADCSALAVDVSPTGWGMGDVLESFPLTDQYGNELESHQFYGMVVVLDFSAGWCGPCNTAAPGMESMWLEYQDQGVVIIHMMIDGWRNGAGFPDGEETFKQEWAERHGLTFPVTTDDHYEYEGNYYSEIYAQFSISGVYEGYIPSFFVLDREHRLVAKPGSDSAIPAAIESHL